MASTREENAALVREFLTSVVASGDTDALGIFLRQDAVDRRPVTDPGVRTDPGRAGYWRALATADIRITIDDVVTADETVAVRGRLTRCHRASMHDGDPIRHPFEIAVAWFCRIENGRIAETWSLPDGQWLMAQLDAPPGGT